jgi:glycosyltransferase involved in cell wall biosynthesis
MKLNHKKNILIFIDWYKPGFKAGGPIQSCANLVEHLKDEFCFSIVTRNTDYGETKPYANVRSNEWITLPDGNKVYYISGDKLNYHTISSFITNKYNAVYLNSFFSFYFTVFPLSFLKRKKDTPKIILAPRGMLGEGALQLKSVKKKIFLAASKLVGLYDNIIWHASTINEAVEIKAVFKSANVVTASNLPPKRELKFVDREKKDNTFKLFFLSRISPKKNLLSVFDYLEKVNEKYKIEFDIIGPVEDEDYWQLCLGKINTLKQKENLTINCKGAIANELLQVQLHQYHFMILPTRNENFGHVILDSFAAGCPVIISDQTPWRDLQSKGIGWDISLSKDDTFVQAMEKASAMKQEEFNSMSKKAFETALGYYQNKDTLEQNRRMFEK